MLIADALAIYGDEHAPHTADPERIGYAIDALLSFWSDHPVSYIKGETCRRYVKHRDKKPGTVRRELGSLRAALQYCVREGYLTFAPAVVLPAKPPPKERHLTRKEAAALLRAAKAEPKARFHLPLFILISLYTGARKEAVLALRWTQNTEGGWIDLDNGRIDFNPVGRAQTKKRRPSPPIHARLLTFLRYAYDRRTGDHVIAFEGERVKNIKRSFSTACDNADIEDASPHVLKHTAITWMLENGGKPYDVSRWTGTSLETIDRVYGHHSPDYLESVKAALA